MGKVLPLPLRGETFLDPRGEGRSLRVSGHPDAGTVVLSVWHHDQCRGTFRIAGSQVDELIRALLAAAPPAPPVITAVDGVSPTVTGSASDDDGDDGAAQTDATETATVEIDENPEAPAAATG